MRLSACASLFFGALALSCAHAPPPHILSDVDAASRGAQAEQSALLAPQAHAHAAELKRRAEQAHADGDGASAQILSENALAAYSHAFVLARLAKAERALTRAKADLAKQKTELEDLDEKQKRVATEADNLEMRIKVAQDALPLTPNAPASAERERARMEAARALASQARLLCIATRLLDPKASELDADSAKLATLEKSLAGSPKVAPIDEARSLRSACLKHLTVARRPATQSQPAAGLADALLAELGRSGELHPFRDDRGVVVTLRGILARNGGLTAEGQKVLESIARVAKAHPEFPLLVVVHSSRSADGEKQGKVVADALGQGGSAKATVTAVGQNQPVVDPSRPGASARNERVEIVFVAPAA
jgi:hypothetical protein